MQYTYGKKPVAMAVELKCWKYRQNKGDSRGRWLGSA